MNGFSLNKASALGVVNTAIDIGDPAYPYTIIMHCPVLSHLVVNDVGSAINTFQPSGFVCMGAVDTAAVISTNAFFGLDPTGVHPLGTAASNYTMDQFYGYSSSVDLETFVYASKMTAKMVIPRATLTGTFYKGKMRLAQFFDNTSTQSASTLSVADLIRVADSVKGMESGFSLNAAMVNDYILTHTLRTGDDTVTDYLKDNDLGAEIIDFVVLQTPAVNITSGIAQKYTIISEVQANAIVLPSAHNLLLYRTFKAISHKKQLKEIDYPYSPIDDGFLDAVEPPASYADLK